MTNNWASSREKEQQPLLKGILELIELVNEARIGADDLDNDYDTEAAETLIIQRTVNLFQSETCSLFYLHKSDKKEETPMLVKSTSGKTIDWQYQVLFNDQTSITQACVQDGLPIMVNHIPSEPLFNSVVDAPKNINGEYQPIHNLLCVPLVAKGQILGAIQVVNKNSGDYDLYDQELLTLEASTIANTIHNSRLIQQLRIANAELETNRWQLLNSQNILRTLFDSIPASIYIINRKYQLVAVNMARGQNSNISSKDEIAQLIGQLCYEALLHRDSLCPGCRVLETLFDGKSTTRTERRWDNEEEPTEWEISSYPIFDDHEQASQAIFLEQNVTDKRRLEATLAQSEKLAAVGQLAAGVAHEINNPLTAIIANAQLLQRELAIQTNLQDKQDIEESLDLIQRAGARAIQVVRNLLNFARKERYELSQTDINENIREALNLLHHEIIGRVIDLTFEAQDELPTIAASPNHLQGVWLNLILNAMDSMENGHGKIKIQTYQVANNIHIKVADSGKGIPKERISRIFEPFYTTKAPDRGTGLGLSVCHRIIKQHGGHIIVDSQVDVGTEFIIVLPIQSI